MFQVKVHSVTDVITNSSEVIYTMASESSIKAIKALVDHILKVGGSALSADDLFEFAFQYDKYQVDEWREERLAADIDEWDDATWQRQRELYKQAEADPPPWWNDFSLDTPLDYDNWQDILVTVTPKDPGAKDAADALSKLHKIFTVEASYNG